MTSRLRSPRSRCRPTRGPSNPRRVTSCGELDPLAHWSAISVVHVEPLVPMLATVRGWDLSAPERERLGALLAAWPYPGAWGLRAACVTYPGRANVEPEPSRQRGVAGDLGAALRDVPDRRSRVRAKREAA